MDFRESKVQTVNTLRLSQLTFFDIAPMETDQPNFNTLTYYNAAYCLLPSIFRCFCSEAI